MRYLVVDISTTAQPGVENSTYLSWVNKRGNFTPEEAYSKAGLHPEYGMICGLAAWWVSFDAGFENYTLHKAYSATASTPEEEEQLLLGLEENLGEDVVLVGHNAQDFIIPFIAKRYLGNGLRLPACIWEAINDKTFYDTMRELACGGASVMSLRASAWMFGIDDPRSGIASPRFYQLCQEHRMGEIEELTNQNAKVAARVFANCVLGNLIQL